MYLINSLIETETDGNDTTYFLLHQLAVIETAIRSLISHQQTHDCAYQTARTDLLKLTDQANN